MENLQDGPRLRRWAGTERNYSNAKKFIPEIIIILRGRGDFEGGRMDERLRDLNGN